MKEYTGYIEKIQPNLDFFEALFYDRFHINERI